MKRPFYIMFMLKKPCLKVQILQYKFLDWKCPPPPFGTFPKIHPFWRRRLSLRKRWMASQLAGQSKPKTSCLTLSLIEASQAKFGDIFLASTYDFLLLKRLSTFSLTGFDEVFLRTFPVAANKWNHCCYHSQKHTMWREGVCLDQPLLMCGLGETAAVQYIFLPHPF